MLVGDVCPVGGEARLFLDAVPESLPRILFIMLCQDVEAVAEGVFRKLDDANPE